MPLLENHKQDPNALGFNGVQPNQIAGRSIEVIWEYIATCLHSMSARKFSDKSNERTLSRELLIELESRRGDRPFFFHKEPGEEDSERSADFAVHARDGEAFLIEGTLFEGRKTLIVLEAKRLPTPGSGREREYIVGNLGGVERFKRGLHGYPLKIVGMIGYIQDRSASYWLTELNNWIDELLQSCIYPPDIIWDEQDKLSPRTVLSYPWVSGQTYPSVSEYYSNPYRIKRKSQKIYYERIKIRHLWVLIGANNNSLLSESSSSLPDTKINPPSSQSDPLEPASIPTV